MIKDKMAVREIDDRDFELSTLQLLDLAVDNIPEEHQKDSPHLAKWQRLHAAIVDVLSEHDPELKAWLAKLEATTA